MSVQYVVMHSTQNLVAINKNLSIVNTICISNSIRFYRQFKQQQKLLLLNIHGYSRLSFGLMIDLLVFHEPKLQLKCHTIYCVLHFLFTLCLFFKTVFVVEMSCLGRMAQTKISHYLRIPRNTREQRKNTTLYCVRILNQGQIQMTSDFGNVFDFVLSFYFSCYFAAYFTLWLCCKFIFIVPLADFCSPGNILRLLLFITVKSICELIIAYLHHQHKQYGQKIETTRMNK